MSFCIGEFSTTEVSSGLVLPGGFLVCPSELSLGSNLATSAGTSTSGLNCLLDLNRRIIRCSSLWIVSGSRTFFLRRTGGRNTSIGSKVGDSLVVSAPLSPLAEVQESSDVSFPITAVVKFFHSFISKIFAIHSIQVNLS